ncbi:hypothetical protein PENTCL1PPCAC_20667, partial [Pristionchus entomophagus]
GTYHIGHAVDFPGERKITLIVPFVLFNRFTQSHSPFVVLPSRLLSVDQLELLERLLITFLVVVIRCNR